jgi:membrane associated rhomboid family serine protease
MIPLGDVIPTRTRPALTFAAMAATAISGAPLLQVASNVLALWLFGPTLEDRMGRVRFLVFVTLCAAIAAGAERAAASGWPVMPGTANGAVAAVVGAYFVLFPRSKVLLLVPFGPAAKILEAPAYTVLGIWFFCQAASAAGVLGPPEIRPIPGVIPSWAHVAGFVTGVATVFVFRSGERQRVEWWNDRLQR